MSTTDTAWLPVHSANTLLLEGSSAVSPVVPAVTSVSGDDQVIAQKEVLRPQSANGCGGCVGGGACHRIRTDMSPTYMATRQPPEPQIVSVAEVLARVQA